MSHDYHFPTMRSTDSKGLLGSSLFQNKYHCWEALAQSRYSSEKKACLTRSGGFSSLWLPCLLVLCTTVTLYALAYLKGGLTAYKTFVTSAQWFDDELLTARISESEECSTSEQGIQICTFPSKSTLFSDNPKNLWIDWDTLLLQATQCPDPCIVSEILPPLLVYDTTIEIANAYCTLPNCMLASTEQINIHDTLDTTGNITILARGDITISSIHVPKNAGALIISTQGTVRVLNSLSTSAITIVHAFPDDQSAFPPLTETFTSLLPIIEGIRGVRVIEER